jgi:nucleoid DNA-binding protein
MEIGLYIAELLSEQDVVSVTGLGTFTKERIAGKFDSQSNLFYPPSYHLSFKETSFNSSLLSEYISLKRDLSTSSSEELIKKFTENIRDILNSSDAIEINHLGILHKENNNLAFKPTEGFKINGKFYGLKPIPELQKESIDLMLLDAIIIYSLLQNKIARIAKDWIERKASENPPDEILVKRLIFNLGKGRYLPYQFYDLIEKELSRDELRFHGILNFNYADFPELKALQEKHYDRILNTQIDNLGSNYKINKTYEDLGDDEREFKF